MFGSSRSRSPSPSSLPLTHPTSPSPKHHRSSRRSLITFIATAIFTGFVFHLLFLGFGGQQAVRDVPVLKDWMPKEKPQEPKVVYEKCPEKEGASKTTPVVHDAAKDTTTDHPGSLSSSWIEEPFDKAGLRAMVDRTKGFYARDYSLGLGWNNMRYIIEQALEQAALLNRTLILPSFVYARSCEWEINSCAAFATMVNRGDAIGWGEWRKLPIEQQMGWRVPMEVMLDIPHLRTVQPVLLISEYLRLHDMDPSKEWSNGAWHKEDYAKISESVTLTTHVIKNNELDPSGVVRVDNREILIKKGVKYSTEADEGIASKKLYLEMQNRKNDVLDWTVATRIIEGYLKDKNDFKATSEFLQENGWAILHTFAGALGMDYLKSVVDPIVQVAPIKSIKGWADDYSHITTDIVVLEGETHLGRKPGGLRFASTEARDGFAKFVLYGLRPISRVRNLADKVKQRMHDKVDGRMWMGGHMRRGDFVTQGWAMEGSVQKHFDRIKSRLAEGRKQLIKIVEEHKITPFDVPDVIPDRSQITLHPPNEGDPFYLATDERTEEGVKYIKENGALLIGDLITIEDRREFGWPIMITDVLALVEQAVLGKGYYFYAHAMSSVAGGAVNMRAARGADKRSTLID